MPAPCKEFSLEEKCLEPLLVVLGMTIAEQPRRG